MNRVRACSMLLLLAILAALCVAVMLPAHSAHAQDDEGPRLEIESVADIEGKRICTLAGTVFDQYLLANYDGISQDDISYYNSNAELIEALKDHKADVMVTDLPVAQLAVN